MTAALADLDPNTRWTVARIAEFVQRGAGNARQVAVLLNIDPDDERFADVWAAALHVGAVRYVAGCCGGGHGWGCEVEAP